MAQKESNSPLSGRTSEILQLLIRTYIASGEPVGSRTLAAFLEGRLSPATIRNTMAELEEAGYLTHPHTSAGRVPSEKGFRFYVDALPDSTRANKASERRLAKLLGDSDTPEELMSRASYVLSEISKNVGIVIAPPLATTQLKHIEFLDLGDGKILVIFVSRSGSLQRKVIRIQEHYPQEELDRAGRFLVERFWGKNLTEIRNELLRIMEAERSLYDRMLKLLHTWNDTLETETEPGPESVFLQGTFRILNQPEFADIDRMRELFQMFEEKGRLVRILNECIASKTMNGVKVGIGSELGIPSMRDFTIVTSNYALRDNTVGFLGIIGPIRMEYDRVISAVGYLGRLVGQRINA
jgi:heat-inducible transcriptional repressor